MLESRVPQPHPPPRSEPREITELRRLKEDNPDLTSAVDLQIDLLQLQRRVQSRVPLPSIRLESEHLNGLLAAGPILQFDHLKIDWSDLRFLLRATAAAMRTHDALEEPDFQRADALCRDGARLPECVRGGCSAGLGGRAELGGGWGGVMAGVLVATRS